MARLKVLDFNKLVVSFEFFEDTWVINVSLNHIIHDVRHIFKGKRIITSVMGLLNQ